MRYTMKIVSIATALPCFSIAHAQSSRPQFEVASIKRNTSGDNSVVVDAARGRFLASNVSLRILLRYAYDPNLPEDEGRRGAVLFDSTSAIEIIGGPAWISNERFDIEAKPTEGRVPAQAELQRLLQGLLEDRFQLKSHYETREASTYDLVIVKQGRLKVSPDKAPAGVPPVPDGRLTMYGGQPSPSGRVVKMYGRAITMAALVPPLQSWTGRRITDKTNFKGAFDVLLQFSPQASTAAVEQAGSPSDPSGPSIFTAIQEQLGLKLESSRGPVEVLVIESVSRPTEN
jgi:uncharacterized protein (TIGR03435 family)